MSESDPSPNRRRNRRRRPASSSPAKAKKQALMAPTKAESALLPPFEGLSPAQILVPRTQAECQSAVNEITAAGIGGFDTEARPTFQAGQKIDGPHVVQFALTGKAFIFQLHRSECEKAAADLISSKQVLKVGFGLKNDHSQIRSRFGIALNHVLDLDEVFRKLGYRKQLGVRAAMGVLRKQCFKKSKSITTSNWALRELSSRQLRYAANDAFAALMIMEALQADGQLEL